MNAPPHCERHVGKIQVTARLFCVGMKADEVTEALGVEPTEAQTAHEPANFGPGGLKGAQECSLWTYETAFKVRSSDINEHLGHLLDVFLPLRSRIEDLRPLPHISVSIYWESTIAGVAGPQIDARCIRGLAELGASLEIKVAKIERVEDDERLSV